MDQQFRWWKYKWRCKLTVNGQAVTLIYVDATKGWRSVNDNQDR